MNKLPKQVYTKEFRENAVKLVVEERLKATEAASIGYRCQRRP